MRSAKAKAAAALKSSRDEDSSSDVAQETPVAKGRKRSTATPRESPRKRTPSSAPAKKKAKVQSKRVSEEELSSDGDKENESDEEYMTEEEEGAEADPADVPVNPKRAACGMPDCKFEGNAADFIAHYKKQHKGFKVAKCPKCKEKFKMLAPLVCHVYRGCYIREDGDGQDTNNDKEGGKEEEQKGDEGEEGEEQDDVDDGDDDDEEE
ncbi:nucleolin-like [Ornithodoros turicata]|uniref:nucleolin-like n=1 Tax=Ornithodoros turicata TaxID=34597 RepID=UPI00313A1D00